MVFTFNIFLKDIFAIDEGICVCNLFLENSPRWWLILNYGCYLFFSKISNPKKSLNEILIWFVKFSSFFHRYPPIALCFFFSTYPERNKIFSHVYVGMSNNILPILNKKTFTNYLSSQVPKNMLWRTPFGRVFKTEYSFVLSMPRRNDGAFPK